MSLNCQYRWCIVPNCHNTTLKTPEKLFIKVPNDIHMRNVWLEQSGRDPTKLSTKSHLHLCEDHFDLEHDMENYTRYKIMGSVKKIRIKPNTVPSRFSRLPIVDPSQAAGSTSMSEHQAVESNSSSENPVAEVTSRSEHQAVEGTSSSEHPGSSTTYLKDEQFQVQIVPVNKINKKNKNHQIMPVIEYKSTQEDLSAHYESKSTQVENDTENYVKYKLVGGRLKLKSNIYPHKFDCQKSAEPSVTLAKQSVYERRQRKELYEKLLASEMLTSSKSCETTERDKMAVEVTKDPLAVDITVAEPLIEAVADSKRNIDIQLNLLISKQNRYKFDKLKVNIKFIDKKEFNKDSNQPADPCNETPANPDTCPDLGRVSQAPAADAGREWAVGDCCCCQRGSYTRNVWAQHDDLLETYGAMIAECTGLDLSSQPQLRVCARCVSRLLEWSRFRRRLRRALAAPRARRAASSTDTCGTDASTDDDIRLDNDFEKADADMRYLSTAEIPIKEEPAEFENVAKVSTEEVMIKQEVLEFENTAAVPTEEVMIKQEIFEYENTADDMIDIVKKEAEDDQVPDPLDSSVEDQPLGAEPGSIEPAELLMVDEAASSKLKQPAKTKGKPSQKGRHGTRKTNRGRKKETSTVDAKPVRAIDHMINDKDNTLFTTIPVSSHAYEHPSSTDCSFIISNVANISDFNEYILNKNLENTVDPSISSNVTHMSDSYASPISKNHENPDDSSICLNVSHISDSYESPSTQNKENVPFSEVGHNSSFDVSLNDIPDYQMHSFCKSSDILSTSFVNTFLLDSEKKISDNPTNVSSVVVIDVPPQVAVNPHAILKYTSHLDSENIEEKPTYLLSTDNVEPPPIIVDPRTTLNHASPLDPENIEKDYTCINNFEPPPKAIESSILSHLKHLDPADSTILNKSTYVADVDDIEKPPLKLPCIISDDRNQDQSVHCFDNESEFSESSNDNNYEPSSYESTSESDQEILMESECLDRSHKATSSYCDGTSPSEKEKIMLREDCLGEDSERNHKTKKENIETEKEIPEDQKTSVSNLKGKRIRERDFCYYCENFILNFSRHMIRNHSAEPEVRSALAHSKNSLKRKQVFSALRKKGNYVRNSQTAFKPVKKCRFSEQTDYLPCSKCLGFYSRKQLWRHVKKCGNTASTNNAQAHAQNFLVRYVKVDQNLMKNVFPRMKPDNISLVAKKDKLICMFGAQYLRTHREEHFVTLVSRKMRELAKLLVEVTKLNPNINSLEQVLKPQYYDSLVQATKIVAGYNEASQKFDAPTYAMNIATCIKQCCSIALLQSYKMEATVQTASVQADLKTLSQLIGENWKFDISSQAAGDLNVKKWNKMSIVPLAADLKLFKDYLCGLSKQSSDSLTQSEGKANVEAFNNLIECIYCRVLLLNRRPPCELQRLKLNDYNDHGNDSNKFEEFDKILTSTEKILVGTLKRIVIRGKRGRGVPVLFSTEVQEDIKKILSVRHMYVVDNNNLLFAKAGGSTVCGYKIFEKYAKASGAENYTALTSTRLRKHLATMTQLFTMTESELEQLATFMGHTLNIHKINCRLPNDIYQTAKISKLLLLMEDGKADEYQGKALDEIELNLDEEIIGNEIENQEVVDFELEEARPSQHISFSRDKPVASSSQEISRKTSAKKRRTLVPWTTDQKNVVTKYFKDHIKYKKPPKRAECDELKNRYATLLHNKDWLKIKVYIQNIYSKS